MIKSGALPYFNEEAVWKALPFSRAISAIEDALLNELDPENDSPRLFSGFPNDGEFLLMPTQGKTLSGVKVLTIAPSNPAKNLEKIQGVYVLFDTETAAPIAIIDGVSLTAIRTPAAALTAVKHLAQAAYPGEELGESPVVLTFGAGIQALNHIRATHFLWPNAVFEIIGRRAERTKALQEELAREGISVKDVAAEKDAAISRADIILACTSTETALFDGALVKDTAIVVATGTHGLERREVDEALVARSEVAVEARASAIRENGNLAHLGLDAESAAAKWWNLQDLVAGKATRSQSTPALYTGVGMSWEDLVVASVVYREGN